MVTVHEEKMKKSSVTVTKSKGKTRSDEIREVDTNVSVGAPERYNGALVK